LLCEQTQGRFRKTIQCPYHAWTYALDGRLIGIPDGHEMGFDKADFPLHQAAIATWEGFLFVNLAAEPESLDNLLDPIAGRVRDWHIATLRVAHRIEYEVRANWKLIAENYNECYHCPLIHPELNQKSHYRSGNTELDRGLILGGYQEITAADSLSFSGETCAPPLGQVSGADLSRVHYYTIFPNMLLSLHPDYVMVHTLWPQAVDRTLVICEWLFDPAALAQPDIDPQDAVKFWDMTNRQDWHACELSQRGVRSKAYTPGPFYDWQETLLAEFDRQVLQALGEEPAIIKRSEEL
jgi:Rieske 2Fe-2S family protein